MNGRLRNTLLAVGLSLVVGNACAQNLLIRNATVHTAGTQGTLQNTDVLVKGGNIAAIGRGLSANGADVIDAGGKPLTPAMFGGVSGIGLEEVSLEDSTTDQSLALGAQSKQMVVRPEFDATLAYNPASVVVPVTRVEGIGFALLTANSGNGGSIIGGQGAVVRLDGGIDPVGARAVRAARQRRRRAQRRQPRRAMDAAGPAGR
jgi:hypothetical protein